jgi:hypothetical protein
MQKPTTFTIPTRLQERFQTLVERTADRFGESPAQARRMVELSVLERGMNMLAQELSEQEAKAHERAVKRNGYAIPKEHQALSSGALQAFEREHGR